jgi:hypothetical protein
MGQDDWKDELRSHFENVRILEKSQAETTGQFEQFCEFIAEPGFENLADELALYGVKAWHKKFGHREIRFSIAFAGSKEEQFQYRISLPKNAVEIRPGLMIRSRKTARGDFATSQELFMPALSPAEILKLNKEDIIRDVLEHYRNSVYEALTSPD